MLNRRFLRMKAFQALYSFSQEEKADPASFRKRLVDNLTKTYNLYLFILSFPVELKAYIQTELEIQQAKFIPSDEAISSLKALLNNQVITLIENNAAFKEKIKKVPAQWSNSNEFFKNILAELRNHKSISDYCSSETHTFQEDKVILGTIIELLFSESELFDSYVEELFYNWEDDQVLVLTTIQKTFSSIKDESSAFIAQMHLDEEEDLKFLKNIFDLCLQHNSVLLELVSLKTQNWDQERIAVVDMVLMKMALCELLYFPFIPVKVTINEYLEIAKLYSTPNSHGFINGILDKIQLDLRKDNRIQKMGRGLVD
ncbi:MAG: transcription antitermination factor NusB [Bacteroidia bacterium]|nr:transcription antitermination factor NusB [Bacteroidia bacterium]